jgi:inorganic phosphate transporter, PiT family
MENVQAALWVVIVLVALALMFDFMNGFHDAANSIATVVSTGVLKPGQAVLFAAFFNLIAIFIFHLSVAATVGKGIVQPGVVDVHVVFGALIGAITWNVITWIYGCLYFCLAPVGIYAGVRDDGHRGVGISASTAFTH